MILASNINQQNPSYGAMRPTVILQPQSFATSSAESGEKRRMLLENLKNDVWGFIHNPDDPNNQQGTIPRFPSDFSSGRYSVRDPLLISVSSKDDSIVSDFKLYIQDGSNKIVLLEVVDGADQLIEEFPLSGTALGAQLIDRQQRNATCTFVGGTCIASAGVMFMIVPRVLMGGGGLSYPASLAVGVTSTVGGMACIFLGLAGTAVSSIPSRNHVPSQIVDSLSCCRSGSSRVYVGYNLEPRKALEDSHVHQSSGAEGGVTTSPPSPPLSFA